MTSNFQLPMTFLAPAKINLSLEILGKREDGFHDLKTLVLPLPGLDDKLTFNPAENFHLLCETPGVPTDETNLVSKAVRIFEKETGIAANWEIHLEKNIPHGAGLGGGSSDAATTLLALRELHQLDLTLETLSAWAATLGSDVPLFLHQSPCFCTGRGEKIEPVTVPFPHSILLLKPAFEVSTPWAYQNWSVSRELPGIPYGPQEIEGLTLLNHLERPVFEKHLFLAQAKKFLLAQPEVLAALMSGSGSTLFAVLRNPADSPALLARAQKNLDPTLWHHLEIPKATGSTPS